MRERDITCGQAIQLPMTIRQRNGRPLVEIHSVRTVMKRGALG
jgi:hypothetical protein